MYLKNANFCLGEASRYKEPDIHLCSLVEKIAWKMCTKQSFDFETEGAKELRFYGRAYDSSKLNNGTLVVTKPIDHLSFNKDDDCAYATVGGKTVKIESFSESLKESLKLLAASALAKKMIRVY